MCEKMEVKFPQYCKNAPLTFYLAVASDPRLKLVGVETLLTAISNSMNETNVNDISTIKTYLEQSYLEYGTQIGRSKIYSTPMGRPQTHKGKRRLFGVL